MRQKSHPMRVVLISICSQFVVTAFGQAFGPVQGISWYMNSPGVVLAHDFDGDGDLDVLSGGDHLSWFENDGSGAFISEHVLLDLSSGTDMQLRDMDEDADLDIVLLLTEAGQRQTRWLENIGNGVYTTLIDVTPVPEYNDCFDLADLDQDGDMDIISTTSPNSLADDALVWYANNGNGTFATGVTIDATSQDIQDILTVDLDEDGDLDLVVTKRSFYMLWYENQGNATFADEQIVDPVWAQTQSVRAGDIDLDGDLDLAATYPFDGDLKWWENDGAENFSEHVITTFFLDAGDIELADLDADGDLDVVGVGGYPRWYENLGDGTFTVGLMVESGNVIVNSVEVTDLNGDGDLDVLWCGRDDRIAWCAGHGDGTFERSATISPQLHTVRPFACKDLDGDDDIDIVAGSVLHDKVSFVENRGDGTFRNPRNISTEDDMALDIHLVDVDGDGHVDVVTASELNDRVAWYRNAGNGTFDAQRGISSTGAASTLVNSMDVDEDGDMDILSAAALAPTRSHRQVDQTLTFTGTVLNPPVSGAKTVVIADLNGDQLQDVLLSQASGITQLTWFPNSPTGIFGAAQTIIGDNSGIRQVLVADLDGDGDMDIVSGSDYYQEILLFRNTGGGVFGPPEVLVNSGPYLEMSMDVGDFDSDGDEDLIFAFYNPGVLVGWYENIGASGPVPAQQETPGSALQDIQLADLDSDGALDIIGANMSMNRLAWMRNGLKAGCTDAAAVNYDPTAVYDNGTCCYTAVGCTVAGASNYSPGNGCEDGSCAFPLAGTVFLDANSNGLQDVSEIGLGGQQVRVFPSNMLLTTDSEGHFHTTVSGSTGYSFLLTDPSSDWNNSTPAFLTFDATVPDWNQPLSFGVVPVGQASGLLADVVPGSSPYPCDGLTVHHIVVANQGNEAIDIDAAFTYDSAFIGYEEVSPIESVDQNTLHFTSAGLAPGSSITFEVLLRTPGEALEGVGLTTSVTVAGLLNGELVADADHSAVTPMSCAAIGQSKQVIPTGETEAHLIPVNTTLRYVLRFQNEGDTEVTDVVIVDTLAAGCAFQTFQVTSASHQVAITQDPASRTVFFTLAGIHLAPGEDGYVSFTVDVALATASLTEIRNTAWILFDGLNQAPTNTTLNTVLDCTSMTAIPDTQAILVCQGTVFGAEVSTEYVTEYVWLFNGGQVGDAAIVSGILAQEAGAQTLTLEYGNGFCTNELDIPVSVSAAPEAEIIGPDGFCTGDSAMLSANLQLPGAWYLDGDLISNVGSIVVDQPGVYVLVLDGEECDSPGDTLMLAEFSLPDVPLIGTQGTALSTVVLAGASYQWLVDGVLIPEATGFLWEPASNGEYTVTITDANGCSAMSAVYYLLNVGVEHRSEAAGALFPNPARDQLTAYIHGATGVCDYHILDALGRSVDIGRRFLTNGRLPLDVSTFVPGMYVLHVRSTKEAAIFSFLVQH